MIIEMSLNHYDRFLEKCDASSREYEILKNGLIVSHRKDGHYERIIEIACEVPEAQIFLLLRGGSIPTPFPPSKKPSPLESYDSDWRCCQPPFKCHDSSALN